jgi:hypothetical protein
MIYRLEKRNKICVIFLLSTTNQSKLCLELFFKESTTRNLLDLVFSLEHLLSERALIVNPHNTIISNSAYISNGKSINLFTSVSNI